MFSLGFEKTAKKKDKASDKASHDNAGAVKDALIGMLPFGTTVQTSMADRPKGHSRLREWGGRQLGAIGGTLAGAAATGGRSRAAMQAGHVLGEGFASKHMRSQSKEKY